MTEQIRTPGPAVQPSTTGRQMAVTAAAVAAIVLAGVLGTVMWYEADREIRVVCDLMAVGTPLDEVQRVLGTGELLRVKPPGVVTGTASTFAFDAPANLGSSRCDVSLDQAGVAGSVLVQAFRLEQVAALAAGCLFVLLCGFQVGLATGKVSGRMAWGGRFETLPASQRRASAVTALLLPVMSWVLLERAAVVDIVGADPAIGLAAWAVTLLFLLSTVGNLASTSPPERKLGIPVATAILLLGCIVAYSG